MKYRPLRDGDLKICAGPCKRMTRNKYVRIDEAPDTVIRADGEMCASCKKKALGEGGRRTGTSMGEEAVKREADAFHAARRARLAKADPSMLVNGRLRRTVSTHQIRGRR